MIGLDLLDDRAVRAGARTQAPASPSGCSRPRSARYAAAKARPGQHLAARFCAKEAVAKALALDGWNFTDVEVVATGGAPDVRLSGAAGARADELGVQVRLSLTHTETTAGAVALAL